MLELPSLAPGETLLCTVRHGLTELNRDRRVGGRLDVDLIDEGRAQAEEAARVLADTRFDVVISSPLSRARETATILTRVADGLLIDAEATERSFGAMEGVRPVEVPERFPEVRYLYVGGIGYSLNPPGGEPFEELHERARRFLRRTLERHAGQRILVVSHQNFLQQLHGVLRGLGPIESLDQDILNCELNWFHLASDGTLLAHDSVQLCSSAARFPSF